LRVNFDNHAHVFSSGGANSNHSYLNDSEDGEDYGGSGSEVTLKVPLNPYHVITEPKTKRVSQL